MDDFKGLCGDGKYPLLSTIVTTLNERNPQPVNRKPVYKPQPSVYTPQSRKAPALTRKRANRNDYKLVPEGADQRTAYTAVSSKRYATEPDNLRYSNAKQNTHITSREYSPRKFTPSVSRMENMNGPLKEPSAERHDFNRRFGKTQDRVKPTSQYDSRHSELYDQYKSGRQNSVNRFEEPNGLYGDTSRQQPRYQAEIDNSKYTSLTKRDSLAKSAPYTEDQSASYVDDAMGVFKYRKEMVIPPGVYPKEDTFHQTEDTNADYSSRYSRGTNDEYREYYSPENSYREPKPHRRNNNKYQLPKADVYHDDMKYQIDDYNDRKKQLAKNAEEYKVPRKTVRREYNVREQKSSECK